MSNYEELIRLGLTNAYQSASRFELNLDTARIVLFSDMHRGTGDRADDFRHSHDCYVNALKYYYSNNFSLYLLGDVEELWEARVDEIITEYSEVLELERSFVTGGRLKRFFGNHDFDLADSEHSAYAQIASFLSDGSNSIMIEEASVASVVSDGTALGELFFVHGHQGTLDSDIYSGISRLFVKYVWRNIQRLMGISLTAPSNNFELRARHEMAMFDWANEQSNLVLVTGHTHHPVFMSTSEECHLKHQADDLEAMKHEGDKKRIAMLYQRRRELVEEAKGFAFDVEREAKPCYFNTGCCSFSDGTITGLEVEDGFITLVRWSPSEERIVLRSPVAVKAIFERCV